MGRVEWSEGIGKLTECKKKEINVQSNWYTLAHEWTLSVTEDFFVLAREGIPQVRWDFQADDDNNDDDISCKNTWASGTDLSKIKLAMMGPEFNKESWFYTSWSPAGRIMFSHFRFHSSPTHLKFQIPWLRAKIIFTTKQHHKYSLSLKS